MHKHFLPKLPWYRLGFSSSPVILSSDLIWRCHVPPDNEIKKTKLQFDTSLRKEFSTLKKALETDANYLVETSEQLYTELHRDHSYKTQFDKKNFLEVIIESSSWRERLNLN